MIMEIREIEHIITNNDILVMFRFDYFASYCIYRVSCNEITSYNYVNNLVIIYLQECSLEIKNLDEITISE